MLNFGAIFSGISNVLSVVANTFAPVLSKILGPALERLGRAFEAFFKELGLIEPEEKVEDIGDRHCRLRLMKLIRCELKLSTITKNI